MFQVILFHRETYEYVDMIFFKKMKNKRNFFLFKKKKRKKKIKKLWFNVEEKRLQVNPALFTTILSGMIFFFFYLIKLAVMSRESLIFISSLFSDTFTSLLLF